MNSFTMLYFEPSRKQSFFTTVFGTNLILKQTVTMRSLRPRQ